MQNPTTTQKRIGKEEEVQKERRKQHLRSSSIKKASTIFHCLFHQFLCVFSECLKIRKKVSLYNVTSEALFTFSKFEFSRQKSTLESKGAGSIVLKIKTIFENETIFFNESILLIFKHCASVVKRKQRVCLPSTSKAAAVSREIFCHNHACTVAHVHI